jgi:hypothetical protein
MLRLSVSATALLALLSLVPACVIGPDGDLDPGAEQTASAASATTGTPTITFTSSWTQTASQPLFAGQAVTIAYDPARLVSQCGGSASSPGGNGGFAWGITGYYAVGNAAAAQFPVTITSAWASGNATLTPPSAGDLQIWFACSNTGGGTGWDSAYGQNYHFPVGPALPPGSGAVQIRVLGDSVVNHAITSTPIANVSVYDGDWQAGNSIGATDGSGQYTAVLPYGQHSIGVMKMTSSHSVLESNGNLVTVSSTPASLDIHVAPTEVQITANYDTGYGNALYITGETSYLGNWQTAYKLSNTAAATWFFQRNLPIGAEYKLILAPWVSGSSISTSAPGVQWMAGNNQVIPAPVNYYASQVSVYPSF